jgi:hypothetical protein
MNISAAGGEASTGMLAFELGQQTLVQSYLRVRPFRRFTYHDAREMEGHIDYCTNLYAYVVPELLVYHELSGLTIESRGTFVNCIDFIFQSIQSGHSFRRQDVQLRFA